MACALTETACAVMLPLIMRLPIQLSLLLSAFLFLAGSVHAESFASWSAKATQAERQGQTEAALQGWTNAIRLWKQTDGKKARAKLFHRRGKLYLQQGKTSDALGDFYKATALNASLAEAFFDRARAYERQGEAKFAREDYRLACAMGYKKACPDVPAKKSSSAQQAKKPSPPMATCAEIVTRCVEGRENGTYTACVAQAKLCENSPGKGCCPSRCVRLFKKALNTKSEAQAFREIFTAKNACAK